MKELTIEEKAKAYDRAKDRMSRAFNSNRCTIGFMMEIFPELKESEDDMIRKMLIHHLTQERGSLSNEDTAEIIAWLEKQANTSKKVTCTQEFEGLTDFERTLADICIGWIGEEPGWKEYIKDNADILLKIAVEKFNSVQDVPFEKSVDKVGPRFKIGDEIRNTEGFKYNTYLVQK